MQPEMLELAFKILKYSQTNEIKDETITTRPKHYSNKLGTNLPVKAKSQDELKKKIANQTKTLNYALTINQIVARISLLLYNCTSILRQL